MKTKNKVIVGIIVFIAAVAAVLIVMSGTYVGQGEVGVVWSMRNGVKEETLGPGFHLVGPVDKVKDYPVSVTIQKIIMMMIMEIITSMQVQMAGL